jgi:ribose 5-phosphate isomerase B
LDLTDNSIALGSDHAGYFLKEKVKSLLRKDGYAVEDFGTDSTDPVDYPDIAVQVARAVAARNHRAGILICGTGIGMSIAANKIPGIRAAMCYSEDTAALCRQHNDANILTLGGRLTHPETALKLVKIFLDTPFDDLERHRRRVGKIHKSTCR